MRNIALVSDTIYGFISGTSNIANRLINELSKNHNIIVMTSSPSKTSFSIQNGIKIYKFNGIRIPMTDKEGYFAFPKKSEIKEILIKDKVDIVHTFLPTYLTYIATKTAKQLNIPVISTYHAQPENVLGNIKINNKYLNYMYYRYNTWLHKKSDYTVVPSNLAKELLMKHKLNLPIKIISNGVPIDIFKPQEHNNIIKKHNLRGYKIVLYVGRLMKEKDIPTLIKSARYVINEIPEVKFVIVGKGYMEEKLKDLINLYNLNNNVILAGKVNHNELPQYYACCDLFVLPSLAELQGLVVLEAMATKKAVIVSDSINSASKELVQKSMVFKAEDDYDLANLILKVLKDDNLREKTAKRNYEYVKKNHSFKATIKQFEELYKIL